MVPDSTVVCKVEIDPILKRANDLNEVIDGPNIIRIEKRNPAGALIGLIQAAISRRRDSAVFLPDYLKVQRFFEAQLRNLVGRWTGRTVIYDNHLDRPTLRD
jgi:hypothetical protein